MSTGFDKLLMAVVNHGIEHPEFDKLLNIGDGQKLCSVAADLIHELRREVNEKQDDISELESEIRDIENNPPHFWFGDSAEVDGNGEDHEGWLCWEYGDYEAGLPGGWALDGASPMAKYIRSLEERVEKCVYEEDYKELESRNEQLEAVITHQIERATRAESVRYDGERLRERIKELEAQLAEEKTAREQAEVWKYAVDEHLVVTHLGTISSFRSPKEALNAIAVYEQGLGEYFAKERIKQLEEQLSTEKAARERAEATTEQSIKTLNACIDRAEAAERRIEQLEEELSMARISTHSAMLREVLSLCKEDPALLEYFRPLLKELYDALAKSQEADDPESLPLSTAPCDCYELIDGFYVNRCDCGNSGDYGEMEVWCHEMNKAAQENDNDYNF